MRSVLFLIVATLVFTPAFAQPAAGGDSLVVRGEALGSKVWAYASHSVINLRHNPRYPAEMTTQVLMGTPLKIVAKRGNWHLVQTPEGYEGWTSSPLAKMDSMEMHRKNQGARAIVTNNNAFVFTATGKSRDIVSEVVMGNILWLSSHKKKKGHYAVTFPDGRSGYIHASAVKTWDDWKNSIQLSGESIEHISKRFTGVPYFWGGTSSRGLDCSGLTKTTYLMHGIILPRDARQQYVTGEAVDSTGGFSHLQKGDLLFFGRKYADDSTRYNIVHTAIYLGNKQFIQAGDGYVQISSLNPADANYDRYNHHRYVVAKRIINRQENGTWSIFDHPWFN